MIMKKLWATFRYDVLLSESFLLDDVFRFLFATFHFDDDLLLATFRCYQNTRLNLPVLHQAESGVRSRTGSATE